MNKRLDNQILSFSFDMHLSNIVLFILLGLPFVINLPKRTNKLFLEMEVVN